MAKYTLKYCETPKDYVDMYQVAQSCMTPARAVTHGVDLKALWKTRRIWPSIFYAYVPDLIGVVLKKDGKGIGRRFIYKKKLVGPAYHVQQPAKFVDDAFGGHYDYGVIYAKKFAELLAEDGYKTSIRGHIQPKSFYIPQVTYKGKPYCPIPRLDFIKCPMYISYDEKNKRFKVSYDKGHYKLFDSYDVSMWLTVGLGGAQ